MGLVEVWDFWNRSVEGLRKKWIEFTSGIIFGLAEEEMRMRREELDKQTDTHNQLE
ncbi:MAG: hypothetical protein WA361_02725 [Candidatus Acidiferrales bacterium]